jgi:diguanylate cyclase (GGDEF)-like protein/PAS domain S-box-containing protein
METLIAPADNIRVSTGIADGVPLFDTNEISGEMVGSILDSIKDAILVLSLDGIIVSANPATFELTGFDRSDLAGRSIELLIGKRLFQKFFRRISATQSIPERIEAFCNRKDGSALPVSISASKVLDPQTGEFRIACVGRDISNRKRLEAEARVISKIIHGVTTTGNLDEFLQLVHRSIKTILNAENFFVALFDEKTELLTMQFFVDKYDPTPPPVKVGRGLTAYVFKQGKPMMFTSAQFQELIAQGEVETVGTDSPIWLGVPLKTPAGQIGVLVVQDYENVDAYSQRDLDLLSSVADQIALAIERKRGEEALRLSQERYDLVTRATSDAVWDWNLLTDGMWWNEGFEKLFGYKRHEIGSDIKSWTDRIHPEDAEQVIRDIHHHVQGGAHNWVDEYRFRRRDGTYAFVIDRGYVVYDEFHNPIRMLGSMMDVTERKSLEKQLTHQALHDPLTKIPNRALFRDRVDHALAKLPRSKSSLAVLFLDLDNFKGINDSLGHAAGDRLLVSVAERLQDCLRTTDTAARLGGDEFAILVEAIHNSEETIMIAERIQAMFQEPFEIEGKMTRVNTSIGIASSAADIVNSEELLRNADLAMYMAKNKGKGRYVIFEPEMHQALMERIALEEDLRKAVENNEFVIHYQPIVDLQSEDMLGMEALARWIHPKFGMLGPLKFIPIAEETNLIVPLGEWILTEACRQTQEWREKLAEGLDLSVTVNISFKQFQDPGLVDAVKKSLSTSNVPPRCLTLEITESFMIQDTEATITKLQDLKALGIRLAIDDFGTGYSSLSYLQRFPIDILKIDKSFVDKVCSGSDGNAVARAIIMMGDSLNLRTIAEGIEHPEQISALQNLGCEAGQGFHFAKPLNKEDMEAFLAGKVEEVTR